MSEVRIVPLCVGTVTRPRSEIVWGADPAPIDLSVIMFYVHADGRHIVVDTGIPAAEDADPRHHPMGRTPDQDPVAALGTLGLAPQDVDIVINTHLHWDHCSNNHLFERATILVQLRELRYAIAPLPLHRGAYGEIETAGGECRSLPAFLRARLTTIDGDLDLGDRIRLLATPGHSPGMQSVLIRTPSRTYLVPGDNIPLYENLDERGPDHFKPTLQHVDLNEYDRSIRRSIALGATILPAHDRRVLEPGEYR